MKKTMKRTLSLILMLALCISLVPAAMAESTEASSISADSPNVTLYYGGASANTTAALTAIVSPTDYTGKVDWSVSRTGIVQFENASALSDTAVTYTDNTGRTRQLITAVGEGSVTVTATAGAHSDTFSVTVRNNTVTNLIISRTANGNGTDANLGSVTLMPDNKLQLYAIGTYLSGAVDVISNNSITWRTTDPAVVNFGSGGDITAIKPGNATITATASGADGAQATATLSVTVTDTPTLSITGPNAETNLTVTAGQTSTLSVNSQDGVILSTVVWSTNDRNVLAFRSGSSTSQTATGQSVTVTGVAGGTATVTATLTYTDSEGNSKTVSASRSVTVSGGDVTALALDSYYYVGIGRSTTVTAETTPVNAAVKSVQWVSSDTSVARVSGTGLTATVTSVSAGTATITAVATSNTGLTTAPVSCRITVSDMSNPDAADTVKTGSNLTLANIHELLSAKFATNYGVTPSTGSTVTFTSLGSSELGTLTRSGGTVFNRNVSANTAYAFTELATMTFASKAAGAYTLPYTLTDPVNGRTMSGVITINITSSDVAITVDLSSASPYIFSSGAAAQIYNTIYSNYGVAFSYIVFANSVESGTSVGALYADAAMTAISNSSSSRTFYYSGANNKLVSELYFVPATSGTYTRTFAAYAASGAKICDCELRIVVPGSAVSMYYNTRANTNLSLDEGLFTQWFQSGTGANYLSYVTLDGMSTSVGSFSCDNNAFIPGTATKFYTGTYTGYKDLSPRHIDDVIYRTANSYYCTYVYFTCYGGSSASSSGVVKSGTLCICVTAGDVGAVNYSVSSGAPRTLDSASFGAVYRTAAGANNTNTPFNIKLLSVPSNGALYYGYNSTAASGTQLTKANCGDYTFAVNSSTSGYAIERLTYVPTSSVGNASFTYAAYSSAGTLLYCGRVIFDTGTGSFQTYSDGYTFKVNDFYKSAASDPIVSLRFSVPASGSLYSNYANGSGTAVTASTRFYTNSVRSGELPLTSLTYIPKVGFTGSDNITFTATTRSGKSETGVITMAVSGKTASSRFRDVTVNATGSWAANAIDYAAAWGLLSGTDANNFSPNATMTRGMLVSVLYRAAGSPAVTGTCPFTDVKDDQYYYRAVIWANRNRIVSGTSSTAFSPNSPVTREQIATLLYNYATYAGTGVSATTSLNTYRDANQVSSYAQNAVRWAVASKIISGTSSATLSPTNPATRAQVAVMLYNYLVD